MPLLETITGGAKVLGALGGIFGGKKKERSPSWNIRSQAEGAREAAREQGFNPLTMLQYGNPGGSMSSGGGEPPLASIDLLVGGLSDLGSVWSGEAAQKRAADRLALDLAQLKLDQARSGVVAVAPLGASASVGGSAPVLGERPATHLTYGGKSLAAWGMGEDMADQPSPVTTMPHDEDLLTAQSAEDMFGEFAGWSQGLYNLGVVGWRNSNDPMREKPKVRPRRKPGTGVGADFARGFDNFNRFNGF